MGCVTTDTVNASKEQEIINEAIKEFATQWRPPHFLKGQLPQIIALERSLETTLLSAKRQDLVENVLKEWIDNKNKDQYLREFLCRLLTDMETRKYQNKLHKLYKYFMQSENVYVKAQGFLGIVTLSTAYRISDHESHRKDRQKVLNTAFALVAGEEKWGYDGFLIDDKRLGLEIIVNYYGRDAVKNIIPSDNWQYLLNHDGVDEETTELLSHDVTKWREQNKNHWQ